jgi:hypothetical protein
MWLWLDKLKFLSDSHRVLNSQWKMAA